MSITGLNLAEALWGSAVPLCKPAFRADGWFICGTEDSQGSPQALVIAQCDLDKRTLAGEGRPAVWIQPTSQYLRDVAWVDDDHVVAALGNVLAFGECKIGDGDIAVRMSASTMRPHEDLIREFRVWGDKIVSGGFDGRLMVTTVRSSHPIPRCIHDAGIVDPVGSVSWHRDGILVSATTDNGKLHVYDIRTRCTSALWSLAIRTHLYGHAWSSDYVAALGFDGGLLQMWDIRHTARHLSETRDKRMQAIGDVRVCEDRQVMALLGTPGITTCSVQDHGMATLCHHHCIERQAPDTYKVSGDFVPGTSMLAAADSSGGLFLVSTAAAPSSELKTIRV